MNSNRGQYNDSPLYNMKTNKRAERKRPAPQVQPQDQGWAQAQPQQPGVAQGMKRHVFLSVVLSFVLPVLFLVALIIPVNELRWAFLAVTALTVLSMWILGAFVRSARNTLTVVYVALAVVIGLALFINQQSPEALRAIAAQNPPSAVQQDQQALLNAMPTETPEPTTDPASLISEAQKRLNGFFDAWGKNQIQEILKYCSPAWINATSAPTNVLFQNLSGNLPLDWQVEADSGSDASASRVITVKAHFQDGADISQYRLNVRMVKTNDVWYVDPNSLDMVPVNEAAEQQASVQNSMVINTTKAPTVTADPNAPKIVVYYNKEGKGKYYHADKICPAVASQWWPLEEFSFDLINSQEYKNLLPCQKCGAPARPSVTQ
ncbi:MAG: hypothetical protein IJI53_00725 [Clostridia bacterium]|nr:hypothetical protein [Clostridia bacterium]MBR0406539.1 hypothetical protein [Clostridia bacterium]